MPLQRPGPHDDDPTDLPTSLAATEQEEMEEDAERLYQQGWAIRQVAARFDTSYAVMRRILERRTSLRRPHGWTD
ncbi:MAG: helix-turn-helix domain-containing protein [Actinoallomurus sp.]